MFSGITASFSRPGHSVSSVSVRPRLKSARHRLMVAFDGPESE
uniref:Uncharacterized protein n=1 Tax=Lepeophtheirus salmonis TaxID=72036 RepID=A0A0K2TWR1_LEPSM